SLVLRTGGRHVLGLCSVLQGTWARHHRPAACRGHTAVGRDLYGDQEHPADEGALHQPVCRRGEADPGGMDRGRTAGQKRAAVDAGIIPPQGLPGRPRRRRSTLRRRCPREHPYAHFSAPMAFPRRSAVSGGADEIMAMILSTASPASGETSILILRASARKSWSCASAAKPAFSAVNRS